MWTWDNAFAFYVVLWYDIVIQFHCICVMQFLLYDTWWNLEKLPRMQCKSDNMEQNNQIFLLTIDAWKYAL